MTAVERRTLAKNERLNRKNVYAKQNLAQRIRCLARNVLLKRVKRLLMLLKVMLDIGKERNKINRLWIREAQLFAVKNIGTME